MKEESKTQSAQAAATEETKGEDGPVTPKHTELAQNADEGVELIQN